MGYYSYKVFEILQYIEYIKNNGDHNLAKNPTPWDNQDFIDWQIRRWRRAGRDQMATASVITSTEILSTKKVISNNPIGKTESAASTTAPEIHAKIVPNKIRKDIVLNKEVVWNVNGIADDDSKVWIAILKLWSRSSFELTRL